MNTMFFVVCIVAIGCTAGVVMEYLRIKGKKEAGAKSADEYEAQIDALEERIRVLERIVTEKKFDLRQEIDKL